MIIVREQLGPSGWSRYETMSGVKRSERSSEAYRNVLVVERSGTY